MFLVFKVIFFESFEIMFEMFDMNNFVLEFCFFLLFILLYILSFIGKGIVFLCKIYGFKEVNVFNFFFLNY